MTDIAIDGTHRKGVCKMYDSERGFGFITDHATGKDVFCHVSELQRANIPEQAFFRGVELSFVLIPGNSKGPRCAELELI
jgi:cold shock CspA family protein